MTENEQRLITALDYINADDYDTWIKVGMALKHEGLPLAIWEGWSRRSTKHVEGECSAKWKSFNEDNAGQPVTGGTLLMMARQNGYTGSGSFTGWYRPQPVIQRPAATETLPADYEPAPIPDVPADYDAAADMKKYLSTLFRPDEKISYCDKLTAQTGKDGKTRFVPLQSTKHRTAGQIIEALSGGVSGAGICAQSEGGALIRFNPMDGRGDADANVADYRYCLIESDTDSLEKQYGLLKALRLPIAVLVHSGNKSLHAITRIDAADAEEYRERVRFVYDYCKRHGLHVDEQDKNASRYSRLAGIKRGDRWQYIIDTDIGAGSFAEWAAWAAVHQTTPAPAAEYRGTADDTLTPAELAAITSAGGKSRAFGFDSDVSELADSASGGAAVYDPATGYKGKKITVPTFPTAAEFCKDRSGIEYLIKWHVQRRALMMIFGQPSGGKSFFALDQAATVASNLPTWHGATLKKPAKVKHGVVLYLTGEGEIGLKQRVAAWAQHNDIALDDLHDLHIRYYTFDLNDPDQVYDFIAGLKAQELKPDWIIFDTLINFMSGDENKAEDASKLIAGCHMIMAAFDCSVTLVHHAGVGEDAQKRPRGSSAFVGAMDIVVYVKRDTDKITAEQTKNKDGIMSTYTFKSEPVTLTDWRDDDGDEITTYALTTSRETKESKGGAIKKEWLPLYEVLRTCCEMGMGELTASGQFRGIKHTVWRDAYCDPTINRKMKVSAKDAARKFEAGVNWLRDNNNIELANNNEIKYDADDRDEAIYIIHDEYSHLMYPAWAEAAQRRKGQTGAADHEETAEDNDSTPVTAPLFKR